MGVLAKLNPQTVQAGGNVATVAVGAPVLIYVGLRYAPTIQSKILFGAIGCTLMYMNAAGLRAAYGSRSSKKPDAGS